MPQQIEAELKRRDAALALANWLLVTDALNTITGKSDPVIDYGTRVKLDSVIGHVDGIEGLMSVLTAKVPDEEGTWNGRAGVSGIEVIPAGGRVLGIAASTTGAGATVDINGLAIPIPWISGIIATVEIAPRANLVAPTITFAGTASYLVEFVT